MHVLATIVTLAAEEPGGETFNPILPETNEIIWGAISFFALFIVLRAKAFPAIRASLKAREDRIRADLEAAEAAKVEAQELLEEYQRQLADARNEAGRIIEEARRSAEQVRRDLIGKAEAEAAELRARAQADIDATIEQARADLQRQMADFAISLAEKIVERSLDRDAQRDLIQRYIAELERLPEAGGVPEEAGAPGARN
jgi:F-type H+-transporting ATPase subunit b